MADSSATHKVTVAVDLPDNASEIVYFYLREANARSTADEVFPRGQEYRLALSAAGIGSIQLPTPDNTGAASWNWHIYLPNQTRYACTIAYSGSTRQLADIIEAGTLL